MFVWMILMEINNDDRYRLLNCNVKVIFSDGTKGDNSHIGKIVWIGKTYFELKTEYGSELLPHKSIIRIEILRDNKKDKGECL